MSQLRCALCQSSVRGAASQPWRRCYRAWYSREEIVARENARSLLPGPRGRCGPERHTKMHAHAQLADPIAAATLLSKSEVESLGSMGFVVRDNWLGSQDKAAEALRFVESLARQGRLTQGVVAGQGAWPAPLGKSLRGDAITWLTADDLTGPEGSVLRELMDSFEALRLHLRRSAFLALHEEYDVQVARYATGTAYVRHADVKRVGSQRTRLITACWYPNVGWNAGADGGSLRLYPDGGQAPVDVAPVGDRLVVFQSSLEHEVLVTHAPRCAFTAWFMK